MNLPIEERIAKLPVWAQDLIRHSTSRVQELEGELRSMELTMRDEHAAFIWVDQLKGIKRYIPGSNYGVSFEMPWIVGNRDHEEIRIQKRRGPYDRIELEIYGTRSLVVRSKITNVITINLE